MSRTGVISAPLIVVIDDEDQSSFVELLKLRGVRAVYSAPDDIHDNSLNAATLIVVDQYLKEWPTRDTGELPIGLRVPDGVSLAAVLRSHTNLAEDNAAASIRPVSIALRTGEIARLGAGLPSNAVEHLLARQHNLEWVFSKGESADGQDQAERVAALALATADLPPSWEPPTVGGLDSWLALPDGVWRDQALWQIEQCRPPQFITAERTSGRAWLRWFLQKILPFPTFLLDRLHLAASLGLKVESIDVVLRASTPLSQALSSIAYVGHLDTFLGARWWRAGAISVIEDLLGDEYTRDTQRIALACEHLHGGPLEKIEFGDPVIAIDAEYYSRETAVSAAESVRLQPDDWPPYADDPWALRDELDAALRALVVLDDRFDSTSPARFDPLSESAEDR